MSFMACRQTLSSGIVILLSNTEVRLLISSLSFFAPRDCPKIGIDERMGQFHNSMAPVWPSRYRNGEIRLVVQTRQDKADLRPAIPDLTRCKSAMGRPQTPLSVVKG